MAADDALPRRLGPYAVEARLGAGGIGVVYRALGPDGRPVAVKVLRASLGTPDLQRRFAREARIRVEHDNVIRVVDAGATEDGAPYLVLELLEGETLAERLQKGRLSAAETVGLGVQVCAGLAAAHAAGVVHRDIKPSNLFLCSDGTCKLIDFGVALIDATETRLTASGGVLGTIGYIAPEIAEGRVVPDARADLWSLGAVLYEALAGRPPFVGATPLASIVAVLLTELEPLRAHAPEVPPALAAVVEHALAKDPARRFADAGQLAEALRTADLRVLDGPAWLPDTRDLQEERRVVALILADGVRDRTALRAQVAAAGGELLPVFADRALAVFGGAAWEGDEVARAAAVALGARALASRMALASGWVTRSAGGLAGGVLTAAEQGCAAGLAGVAVDAEAARGLASSHTLVPVREGLWELGRGSAAPTGGPLPTIGREAEIAELRRALRTVTLDRASLAVLVVGPIGSGKSRLRHELERLVAEAGLADRVLFARGEPHRQGRRFALLEALARGAAPAAGLGRLAQLLGRSIDDPQAAATSDPQTLLDRVRVALLDALRGRLAAGSGLVILILEDLHWADRESLDLLDDVLGELADAPLLVCATLRPELLEARPAPLSALEGLRIEARGLLRADVAELVQAATGLPPSDELVRALAERTAGNPFFVLETVRALQEAGAEAASLPLPLTVEAAVQSRLDHLPTEEKELCKRAAVWGRPFSAEELADLGVVQAQELLTSLARRELAVARARRGAAPRWELRSSLVGEVAYRMLPDAARAALHRRVAELLERARSGDLEELAGHRERGGEVALAARDWSRAVLEAAGRGDVRAVLRCAERALALGVAAEERFALHMASVDALRFLGQREDQRVALEAALCTASTDAERARALSEQSVWLRRAGRGLEALGAAEQAVEAARRAGGGEVLALARGRQCLALSEAGRFAEARAALDEATALSGGRGPALEALALEWTGQLASATGDLGARRAAFAALVELHGRLGDLRRAAGAEVNLADVWCRVGAYGDAAAALRAARESCRRIGQRVMEGYALVNLGYALTMLGEPDAALQVLAEADGLAASLREARLAVLAGTYRARALVALGRADEAAATADETATAAERGGAPGLCAGALAVAARAHLIARRVPEALERSARALAIRDAQGGLEEDEADVFLARADALRAAGDAAAADAILTAGHARLAEIAAGISDPDLRQRFGDTHSLARSAKSKRS